MMNIYRSSLNNYTAYWNAEGNIIYSRLCLRVKILLLMSTSLPHMHDVAVVLLFPKLCNIITAETLGPVVRSPFSLNG